MVKDNWLLAVPDPQGDVRTLICGPGGCRRLPNGTKRGRNALKPLRRGTKKAAKRGCRVSSRHKKRPENFYGSKLDERSERHKLVDIARAQSGVRRACPMSLAKSRAVKDCLAVPPTPGEDRRSAAEAPSCEGLLFSEPHLLPPVSMQPQRLQSSGLRLSPSVS
jgi:hypothetical protein